MRLSTLVLCGSLSLASFAAARADTFTASGFTYTVPGQGTITASSSSGFDASGGTTQAFTETLFGTNEFTVDQTITIDGVSATLPVTVSEAVMTSGPLRGDISFVIYGSSVTVGKFLFTEDSFVALVTTSPFSGTLTGTITPTPTATTVTPEPSSLLLLGTGLLTVLGSQRRRFARTTWHP